MAEGDGRYIALADLVAHLGKSGDDQLQDQEEDFLKALIPRAEAMFDKRTQTWWDSKDGTFTLSAPSARTVELYLPVPIITITALTDDGDALSIVDGEDFYALKGQGILRMASGYWNPTPNSLVLEGTFGYAATPEEIKELVLQLAGVLSGMRTKTYTSKEGVAGVTDMLSLPKFLEDMIDSRRWTDLSTGQVEWLEAVPTP